MTVAELKREIEGVDDHTEVKLGTPSGGVLNAVSAHCKSVSVGEVRLLRNTGELGDTYMPVSDRCFVIDGGE